MNASKINKIALVGYCFQCFLFIGDGIAIKGHAYGIRSIRVDGNDALAIHSAIRAARQMAIKEQKSILVEVKFNSLYIY